MNNPTHSLTLEIKAEMTRQQLTSADLAERCELSVHQVNRRLSGTVDLTIADALLIADALAVPLHKLMERAEPAKSNAGMPTTPERAA